MMPIIQPSYDCIVIGGGPAGTTVAALVAEAGRRTLLLEREAMPRFSVGESLMPETYWVFQRLGLLETMNSSDFVKKVSVQFISHSGRESAPFFFRDHDPRPCHQTWQVERARFDQMLFDNAAAKGADCHDQVRVRDVLFEHDRAVGVRIEPADGDVRDVRAPVVVDATGQQSLIATRLGLKQPDPELRKVAVWTYYRGAAREAGDHGGATVILHTATRKSWFWYIPQADDVTSIGVVGDHAQLFSQGRSPDDAFARQLAECAPLEQRLAGAHRIEKFRVAKEFSYRTQRAAGDGWVLVGDAWGFIDPVYSSGVYFAMKSGELAADAVVAALAAGQPSADRLGNWVDEFNAGAMWMRKLVRAFYNEKFSVGQFLKQYPQHAGNLTDLLIGRVFQPGAGRIFEDLDVWLAEAESSAVDERSAPSGC